VIGPDFSKNYDNIAFIFTTEFWKVHSAKSKQNGDRVSLWQIDREALEQRILSTPRANYLSPSLFFRHSKAPKACFTPHYLKILEFQSQSNLTQLGFVSEPISTCLSTMIWFFEPC
jgi:hypothetical protein